MDINDQKQIEWLHKAQLEVNDLLKQCQHFQMMGGLYGTQSSSLDIQKIMKYLNELLYNYRLIMNENNNLKNKIKDLEEKIIGLENSEIY